MSSQNSVYTVTSRGLDQSSSWKWLVLFAAFMAVLVNSSLSYHVGVLNLAVIDKFSPDPEALSWLLSIYITMFALPAPLASVVISYSNCKTCVFLAGVISLVGYVASSFADSFQVFFCTLIFAGMGHGLSQSGAILVLGFYFPDNVAVVNGICLAGSGLGSFIHPFLLQTLIENYGLSGALLLVGGIAFNACATALVFRPIKAEVPNSVDSPRDKTNKVPFCDNILSHLGVFGEPSFFTFSLGIFSYSLVLHTIIVYLPEYIVRVVGLSKHQASLTASAMGMGSVVSRLLVGFAASDQRIGEYLLFIGINCIAGILCFTSTVILHTKHFVAAIIFTTAIGIYTSGTFTLINPIIIDVMGVQKATAGYGVVMMVCGLGGILGAPVTTFVLQKTHFEALFTIFGFIFLLVSVLAVVTLELKNRSRTTKELDVKVKDSSGSSRDFYQSVDLISKREESTTIL